MANLETFKAKIGGGIRPNQFRVRLNTGMTGVDLSSNLFEFLCHSSSLPGSNIGQAMAFHRGRAIPLAGERTFEPWTVSIYADQDMNIRSRFEDWSDLINNYLDNSGETDPVNYKGTAEVVLLNRNGDIPIYTYNMQGIFPLNISEMQLSWQANDVLGEFSVTFAIENFTSVQGAAIGGF